MPGSSPTSQKTGGCFTGRWIVALAGLCAVCAPAQAQGNGPKPFPNAATAGVPPGWQPRDTRESDVVVSQPGAVVEDLRIVDGNLLVDAENVTVRRVELLGGRIVNDPANACRNGLTVEDTSILPSRDKAKASEYPAITTGGYTARRVRIDGVAEGFRVGGVSHGCGPVTIEDSFVRVVSPEPCGDWHGDGIQGYDGPPLTVHNVTLHLDERPGCGGTAPFFYPDKQGNTSARIDGLLVQGGGYLFRLGVPASVRGLSIVAQSWGYGPIDVKCSAVGSWEAEIVTAGADYQPKAILRRQRCDTEAGN
ncbi:hypothetical protein [Aureimonas sp. AU40]|uniref:hypothetical protein n=1 Tax=Aureimonas sp. AU40 TaxID=1637747 RepID=UPI0007845B66|nr:hypothetical protein [Aureimonas sp. AU40]